MSLFSRLFGGSSGPEAKAEPEVYKGFRIFADPVREGSGFRIAARIEKEVGGEIKSHRMVRADTCDSVDTAREMTTTKAKMLIDQQGDAIFRA